MGYFSIFESDTTDKNYSDSPIISSYVVGGIFWILFSLGGIGTYLWDEAIGIVLVIAAFIAQFLAVRGIRKDEELVKSIDRLRSRIFMRSYTNAKY